MLRRMSTPVGEEIAHKRFDPAPLRYVIDGLRLFGAIAPI